MKLTEDFVKHPEGRTYNWGQNEKPVLKGDYSKEKIHSEVISWRLSPKDMAKYLKKFENKEALEVPRVNV